MTVRIDRHHYAIERQPVRPGQGVHSLCGCRFSSPNLSAPFEVGKMHQLPPRTMLDCPRCWERLENEMMWVEGVVFVYGIIRQYKAKEQVTQ